MMIHLVTQDRRDRYRAQIDAMHRLRWRIYVEERGWRELRDMQAQEGFERDEYDDARAHYLLAIDDDGAVLGAMRLRPTADKSLIADRFLHLVENPRALGLGAGVWELTRLLRAPLTRSRDGAVRYAMNCGLIEFCLARSIARLVATGDSFLLPMTRKAWGQKVRPLGLPQPYEEGEVIALELFPDAEALAAMRTAGAIAGAQLYQHPEPLKALDRDPVRAARLMRLQERCAGAPGAAEAA
jgi:acyl-homoserine lactone synthase